MAGIGHRGFMGRKKEPPSCSGISYGSYNGTKSIYNDGVNNFLRNPDFSYDNSVTGFTILSVWYLNTALQVDFNYLLNIKNTTTRDVGIEVGTDEIFISNTNSALSHSRSVDVQTPIFCAQSYKPDGAGSINYFSINGDSVSIIDPIIKAANWTDPAREFYLFRRNGGSNRAPGNCAFLQIIDQPISELCCAQWTSSAQPRNIVGAFNDIMLLDFESGVLNNGTNDVIQDLSANNYDVILDGYSAAQKDPLNPAYCIKNIP